MSESVVKKFADLGIADWLIRQCVAVGISRPTPIQRNCIPEILKGHDCIGCARTGSGKTAAFALPLLHKLSEDPYGIFAIVLTPTRELAFQISEHFKALGQPMGLKVCVVTGGRDMIEQGRELCDRPHVVVATPGRLADHISSSTNFSLSRIRFLVLDEADRLLEDNFGEQLQTIFAALPQQRQTLLFSATLTESLKQLEQVAVNKPFFWTEESRAATVDELTQQYVLMPASVKDAYLVHIIDQYLDEHPKGLMMIFVQTCKYCQVLSLVLEGLGIACLPLHSMIPQRQRLASLAKFKSHQVRILVATDVASRGLDIPTVDLVINHNVPTKPKDYLHRVGRTARAGRVGNALTLVTQFDIKLLHAIEERINTKLSDYSVNEDKVKAIAVEVAVAKREAEIKLDEQDFGEKKNINKRKKLIEAGEVPDKFTAKNKRTKR